MLINKFINGCCDISDGLGKEITYFKNFEIYSDKIFKLIPEDVIEFCEEFNLDPLKVVLNSGEEFELLFTTSKFNKVKSLISDFSSIYKIGRIIEDGQFIDGEKFCGGGYVHKW